MLNKENNIIGWSTYRGWTLHVQSSIFDVSFMQPVGGHLGSFQMYPLPNREIAAFVRQSSFGEDLHIQVRTHGTQE